MKDESLIFSSLRGLIDYQLKECGRSNIVEFGVQAQVFLMDGQLSFPIVLEVPPEGFLQQLIGANGEALMQLLGRTWGRRIVEPEGSKTQPTESTKQGSEEVTETEAAITGPTWSCASSSIYMLGVVQLGVLGGLFK